MSTVTETRAKPVAWRWEGRDRRTGYWTRMLTSYEPTQNGSDDKYCRNVEPLFLAAPSSGDA